MLPAALWAAVVKLLTHRDAHNGLYGLQHLLAEAQAPAGQQAGEFLEKLNPKLGGPWSQHETSFGSHSSSVGKTPFNDATLNACLLRPAAAPIRLLWPTLRDIQEVHRSGGDTVGCVGLCSDTDAYSKYFHRLESPQRGQAVAYHAKLLWQRCRDPQTGEQYGWLYTG
jgi:hypothetical protein